MRLAYQQQLLRDPHTDPDPYSHAYADPHGNTYCDANSYANSDAYSDTRADHPQCTRLQGARAAGGGPLLEWS